MKADGNDQGVTTRAKGAFETLLAEEKNKSKMKTNVAPRSSARLHKRPEPVEELKEGKGPPKRIVKPNPDSM